MTTIRMLVPAAGPHLALHAGDTVQTTDEAAEMMVLRGFAEVVADPAPEPAAAPEPEPEPAKPADAT